MIHYSFNMDFWLMCPRVAVPDSPHPDYLSFTDNYDSDNPKLTELMEGLQDVVDPVGMWVWDEPTHRDYGDKPVWECPVWNVDHPPMERKPADL